jgi:hypothetical protein
MMYAWSFSCLQAADVGALLKALGKHRYVSEVEHRLHWVVDAALSSHPTFAPYAREFQAKRKANPSLEVASYDPQLWRLASADEIGQALQVFWAGDQAANDAAQRLRAMVQALDLPWPEHEPFQGDPEYPDHPCLIQMSWTLFPICELDADRHAGALAAMEHAEEEVDISLAIDQEGPDLGVIELCAGAKNGKMLEPLVIWADGSRSYNDYVFRGAAKMAKLSAPEPWSDEEDEDESPDENG